MDGGEDAQMQAAIVVKPGSKDDAAMLIHGDGMSKMMAQKRCGELASRRMENRIPPNSLQAEEMDYMDGQQLVVA